MTKVLGVPLRYALPIIVLSVTAALNVLMEGYRCRLGCALEPWWQRSACEAKCPTILEAVGALLGGFTGLVLGYHVVAKLGSFLRRLRKRRAT